MAICNHDCNRCLHSDCINDEITVTEIVASMERDAKFENYGKLHKGRPTKSRRKGVIE